MFAKKKAHCKTKQTNYESSAIIMRNNLEISRLLISIMPLIRLVTLIVYKASNKWGLLSVGSL